MIINIQPIKGVWNVRSAILDSLKNADVVEITDAPCTELEEQNHKLISGFLCSPETAFTEFQIVWKQVELQKRGAHNTVSDRLENMAYLIIQSFPNDTAITGMDVHRCGLELLQKIGDHQGIVCSYISPESDGAGKKRFNRIIFNAYKHPSKIDPDYPRRTKYNDCSASYRQLMQWNDMIAIDHGLPVIFKKEIEE